MQAFPFAAAGPPFSRQSLARVLIYSHDTFGLGHLRRSRAIANALVSERPGVSVLGAVGVPGQADRDPVADDILWSDHLGGPTGAEEVLRLDAACVRRQHGRAPGLLGPHEQHLAGVRVRRPRLGEQVVAVVPDRHQPEIVNR